ncbi:T9SS type A sorting domain-containing protein [Runella aurantiaca]|uniref:T9SS C-terminal target domain-containing protein n=1 Tax=Runella aurantiaca TaxID=2282308 RepID=A0A369I5P2_9BACT|nr:T9SS type A sorting domain-containing protein [Runella aurantiaca]RDB05059.1 T9SS C-terminal target domain-containing protein [Runella aurantiaca]
MKKIYLSLFLVLTWLKGFSAGEIAFVAFQSDDPDSFSWVALVPIPAGTTIFFTDNGWNGTAFRTSEGVLTWTAPAGGVPAGTVVTITGTSTASTGTVVASLGSFSLAAAGDQIFAFKGTLASPTFIAAINFGSTGWVDDNMPASTNTTALPAALTNGSNAVAVGNQDNGRFNCSDGSEMGNIATIGANINTTTNWTTSATPLSPAVSACTYTSSSLPVRLISFKSEAHSAAIELTWQTGEEIDNSHFEIERSSNAQNFEAIGRVIGQGNSTAKLVYSYVDVSPKTGLNYYRLKQVDLDGQFEYSRIVSARLTGLGLFKAYPNPVVGILTIELPSESTIESACLIDLTGRKVREFFDSNVSVEGVENGMYTLQVKTKDGRTFQQRVLKIN